MAPEPDGKARSSNEPGILLGAIFSASPDAVIVVDETGTIVLSSPATTSLFGYYPEELVGASIATLIPLGRREAHSAHLAGFFAAPHGRQMGAGLELAGRHRDGSEFPVEVSLAPVELRGRQYAAAFVRDASERQRSIERLHAVNDVIQRLLAGTSISELLPVVARQARELSRSDATWVVLPEPDGELEVVAADGEGTEILFGVRLSATTSRSAETMRTGIPEVITDFGVAENVPDQLRELGLGPGLYVPLSGKDRSLGALVFGRAHGAPVFASVDVAFAQAFAAAIATAFELGEARDELERLGIVSEDERIARDLHDTVIQQLFAIGMSLQATGNLLEGAAHKRVESAMDGLDAVIKEIRNTIFRLPMRSVADAGLREELFEVAEGVREQLGFSPRLTFDGPVDLAITEEVEAHLRNVFVEALSNVARHAHATSVEAVISLSDDWLTLTVADDGVGLGDGLSAGNGLRNLRERAAALGGTFELRPRSPSGTVLEWRVPI